MKILFLSQIVPYPPHGGVLQRGYNIIRQLSKYNDVHLLAYVHPDTLLSEDDINKAKDELLKYCKKVEFFDLWVKKSAFYKFTGLMWSLVSRYPFSVIAHYSPALKKRVIQLTQAQSFDIVHYDTLALCRFSTGKTPTTKMLTHHNIESKLMERRAAFEKNPLIKMYLKLQVRRLKFYEAFLIDKHASNIVMSDIDGNELKKYKSRINVDVIPNGVDTNYYKPGPEGNEPSLVYTGGMNMFANRDAVMEFLLRIWPIIKKEIPEVKFYAVGQDPPEELKELSKIDKNIIVTGFVDDIRPIVQAAFLYVVPLRVGGGTRLKVLDALSTGKAILSTSVGCEGIEVIDGENIIIADEPEIFAKKAIELLEDPGKRLSLGKAARKLAENKYDWKVIGRQMQSIYERSVGHYKYRGPNESNN